MFAALLEILSIGEKIKAPVDVNGKWEIHTEISDDPRAGCLPLILPEKNTVFSIEQSGKHLLLIINDAYISEVNGKLEKDSMFFARTYEGEDSLNCRNIPFVLVLNIDNYKDKPKQLSGTLRMPGWKNITEVHFKAIKLS